MHSTLILEFSGEIAKLTLNRPDKRNAINAQMIAELQTALDTIEKSHSRVVIVTGAGTSFCAGMDLDMLAAIAKQSPAENQEDSRRIAKMLRRLWRFPRPMVAAGGAKWGSTGVKSGSRPEIVVVFLAGQMGDKRARDLLRTGRIMKAAEARDFGGVTEVVPADRLQERALELANDLIAASPSSLTRAKHLLTSAAAAGVNHHLDRAFLGTSRIRCTPAFKEGVVSFLEK